MTAALESDRPLVERPARPRPGFFGVGVSAALIVLTIVSWRFTQFSVTDLRSKFLNRNPVLEAIPNIEWEQLWSPRTIGPFLDTLRVAVLATIAGAIVSLPLALWSTGIGAPNRIVQAIARNLSSLIRSLPDIIWALLFVAAVGTGDLAGLLALFFFSIAVISKLTADTVDGIDLGPIEAADASGATHTQRLGTAVVPQILPAYASYVLYSFELNLRGSAVLGLVGAGGIGERIDDFKNLLRWDRLWAIVVLFVIVVFVVDRLSTLLRRRLV